jgi:hypothetical protein
MKKFIYIALLILTSITNAIAQQGYLSVSVVPNCNSYQVDIGYNPPPDCTLQGGIWGTITIRQGTQVIASTSGSTYSNSLTLLPNTTYSVQATVMKSECGGSSYWENVSTSFVTPPFSGLTIDGNFQLGCDNKGILTYTVTGGNDSPVTVTAGGTNYPGRTGSIPTTGINTLTLNASQQGSCTSSKVFNAAAPNVGITGVFTQTCTEGNFSYSITGTDTQTPVIVTAAGRTNSDRIGNIPIPSNFVGQLDVHVQQGSLCSIDRSFAPISASGLVLSIRISDFIGNCSSGGTIPYSVTGGNNNTAIIVNGSISSTDNGRNGILAVSAGNNTFTATQGTCRSNSVSFTPTPPAPFTLTFTNFVPNGTGGGTVQYSAGGGSATGGALIVSWPGAAANPASGTATITGPTVFTVTQNGCSQDFPYSPIVTPPPPPCNIGAHATWTSNCGTITGTLRITGNSGIVTVTAFNTSGFGTSVTGSLPIIIPNFADPMYVNVDNNECTISTPIYIINSPLADFSVVGGSYFYCDPLSQTASQDGRIYVQLSGNAPSGQYEIWGNESATGGTFEKLVDASGVSTFTLSGGTLTLRRPGPPNNYARQIFRVKVSKVGTPNCQTEEFTLNPLTQPMSVEIEYPSPDYLYCLPSGDEVTVNITVSVPRDNNYIALHGYRDRIFIVEASLFEIRACDNNQIPPINTPCNGSVAINEIQNIAATFVDDVNGIYRFAMKFRQKAPFRLTGFAVTHRSGDGSQPAGLYGSNCYKAPFAVNKVFMPYLPPPTAQVRNHCGNTFIGDVTFDPLICNIFPKEWDIMGINYLGNSTLLQNVIFSPATGMSCTYSFSFNNNNNIQSMYLRHRLTGCTTPIIVNGGAGVGGNTATTIEVVPYGDNCGGGYQLIAPAGYDNYVWYPGNQTTQSIFVTQAGNYRVTMSRNTGSCYGINAQVTVGAPPVPPALTASVTYRDCNTADIRAVDGFTSYTWYNSLGEEVAQTQNMLGVTITDTYRVVARKGACTKEFEVVVNFSDLQLFAYPNGDCSNYQLVASPGFTSYLWSNGATSSSITVSVDGTYTVTATRGTCTQTATATVNGVNGTVSVSQNITKLVIPNVLATSASTFSEQWLRTGSPLIVSPSGFGNGQRGIWKPHETYAYITGRQRATNSLGELITPNVDKDGVFELSLFNWKYHGVLTCPEWIKTQQVTQYNAANFEIENKDILDRYTSALYGYQQQLPIATAGNARADEIAFESFEEYANSTIAITDVSSNDNNLDLLTESSSAAITNYQWLSVELGLPKTSNQEHLVYVKGRVFTDSDNNNITNFPINNVFIKGYRFDDQNPGVFIWRANIKASKYLENRDMTQLVLTTQAGEVEPYCYWKGELAISKSSNLELVVNATMSLQNQQKHTGKKALKIQKLQSTDTKLLEFNPKRLHLIPKKKYVLSAWVKLASSDPCNGETSFSKSIPQTGMIEEIPPVDFPPSDFPPSETEDPQNPTDPLPCSGTPYSVRKKDYSYQLETPIETMVNLVSFSFLTPGNRSQIAATNTTYSDVIEGWVRIEHEFIAEHEQVIIELNNKNENLNILYLDDIRIHPFNSALQTYVYDTQNYKLRATLDGNNFSSLYFYDEQGNLYLTKKETERGIQTIQEALSHQKQR